MAQTLFIIGGAAVGLLILVLGELFVEWITGRDEASHDEI